MKQFDIRSVSLLFVKAMHAWVIFFVVLGFAQFGRLWLNPVSPRLSFPNGPIAWLDALTFTLPLGFWIVLPIVSVILCTISVLRKSTWWLSLLIWCAYVILIARGWMASTGGQQLISIMLLWCIPLSVQGQSGFKEFAFWAARLQLVLVYLSTFLHKLQGEDWLSGNALSILSTDPTFNLFWLADLPVLASLLSWGGFVFQLLFPLLIWFKAFRAPLFAIGCIFHAFLAYAIEIPDMSLAFVCCYVIWLNDEQLQAWSGRLLPSSLKNIV